MKSRCFLLALCLGACLTLSAENEYALELQTDKTIIHPEQMGYNENATLEDVLRLLPELVNRTNGSLLSNYSVQLDDKDVGGAKDVVLMQTRLIEIDCIEVSTLPTVSEQANGHGGTINIKLRHPEEGTHGTAAVGVSTSWYVQPAVYVTHKKGKLDLRTTMLLEYFSPTVDIERRCLRKREPDDPHRTLFLENENWRARDLNQTAKLDLQYKFDEQNLLRLWAIEQGNLEWKNEHSDAESHTAIIADTVFHFRFGESEKRTDQRNIYVNAVAEYKHFYKAGGELVINAGYNYHPGYSMTHVDVNGDYFTGRRDLYNLSRSRRHEVGGKLSTKNVLPIPNPDHHLTMETGVNATYSYAASHGIDSVWWASNTISTLALTDKDAREIYLSPYLEWQYRWGGLNAKMGVRYQYYRRNYLLNQWYGPTLISDTTDQGQNFVTNHDVTANINLTYDFNSRHRIRLMTARHLVRPSDMQNYPGFAIDWSSLTAYERNSVGNAHTYNVDFNYIFDWRRDQHRLFINAGVGYIHSVDLIESKAERMEAAPEISKMSFYNSGKSHIATADLSLCYRYAGFSLCFSGSTFYSKNRYYYNLSFLPMYAFPREWYLAGQFVYYSRVQTGQSYIGDCFYTQLRLHKNIGQWMVYMELDDIFNFLTTDKTVYSANEYQSTSYHLYKRALAAGFTYKF